MSAVPSPLDAKPGPNATVYVTLTKQAHIELVTQANSWKSLHRRAVERAQWREGRYQRVLRQIKEQAADREVALRAELGVAHAKIRALQQRMFGRKSQRRRGGTEQQVQALVTDARCSRTCPSAVSLSSSTHPSVRTAAWRWAASQAPKTARCWRSRSRPTGA